MKKDENNKQQANRKAARYEDDNYPPLEKINRPYVPTSHAAYYLALAPQTLRAMHSEQKYDPRLKPKKIHKNLMWPVDGIKAILGK